MVRGKGTIMFTEFGKLFSIHTSDMAQSKNIALWIEMLWDVIYSIVDTVRKSLHMCRSSDIHCADSYLNPKSRLPKQCDIHSHTHRTEDVSSAVQAVSVSVTHSLRQHRHGQGIHTYLDIHLAHYFSRELAALNVLSPNSVCLFWQQSSMDKSMEDAKSVESVFCITSLSAMI